MTKYPYKEFRYYTSGYGTWRDHMIIACDTHFERFWSQVTIFVLLKCLCSEMQNCRLCTCETENDLIDTISAIAWWIPKDA